MAKFITFADGSLGIKSAARRLVKQALASGYFEGGCESWDVTKLIEADKEFKVSHLDFLGSNPKGLGYWVWQPAFLLAAMNESVEGEIIVALDSGCQIVSNTLAAKRMSEYLEMVQSEGFLFIQVKENSFGISDLREQTWTKKSCIEYFQLSKFQLNQTQIQSGIIFVKNSPISRDFVSRWYENCVRDSYSLLIDPGPLEIQEVNFASHRYAQSILSCMVKEERLPRIDDETYWYPNWSQGLSFPIWTMRNRSGGDAFRRNFLDLLLIAFARIERNYKNAKLNPSNHFRHRIR